MVLNFEDRYFQWLCDVAMGRNSIMYSHLLYLLHHTEFQFSYALDKNRYLDGIGMRHRFYMDNPELFGEFSPDDIFGEMSCTVLEMMVALSVRINESILANYFGDSNGIYILFNAMLNSLNIVRYDNNHFNERRVQCILEDFMNHNYERNGAGGLFTIHDDTKDMRQEEIWCQCGWYLNELIENSI